MCGRSEERLGEFWRAVQQLWILLYGSRLATVAAVNVSRAWATPPEGAPQAAGRAQARAALLACEGALPLHFPPPENGKGCCFDLGGGCAPNQPRMAAVPLPPDPPPQEKVFPC